MICTLFSSNPLPKEIRGERRTERKNKADAADTHGSCAATWVFILSSGFHKLLIILVLWK
jgi:hypothetical protein